MALVAPCHLELHAETARKLCTGSLSSGAGAPAASLAAILRRSGDGSGNVPTVSP